MSSEGSSRLRQFGLYKTIDSQTAEFLKLSRKRQIRRGCACAAVSTAITVTVVVCALLVYELRFRTNFKTTPDPLRKPSWFNEVNDSKATFDYQKNSPANVKNNGKLIAVILKTLDQKRYLESILDDISSQTPLREITTVYPFQKDVFKNAKNKKLPVAYKPPRFFQNRRKDSAVKARKIMDYQRVMTYLNSMAFNKIAEESTQATTSSSQHNLQPTDGEVKREKNYNVKPEIDRTQKSCVCPSRSNLTDILEKLYTAIQQLRPKVMENKTIKSECNKRFQATTVKIKPTKGYFSDIRTTMSTKNNKHITLKPSPILKIETDTHNSIRILRNNDTYKDETKSNETTPKLSVSSTIAYNNSGYKEEPTWKHDLGSTDYDETAAVYAQAEHSDAIPDNNKTKANSSESDVSYDYDDRINHFPQAPVQYIRALDKKTQKSPEYYYLATYIDGLSKLQNMIVNTPPTLSPTKEETKVTEFDLKHMFSQEIGSPLKPVTTTTEIRYVKPVQRLEEKEYKYLSSTKTPETADKNAYKLNILTKINNKQTKSSMEAVSNKAKEKANKKENSAILNLEVTTVSPINVSNSILTDSSEDLPFNLKFFEDDERSSNLKPLIKSPVLKVQQPKESIVKPVNNNKEPSRDTATKAEPFGLKFFEDELEQSNISPKAFTTTSVTSVKEQEKSKSEAVVENREPTRKKARKNEKTLSKTQLLDPTNNQNPTEIPSPRRKRPKIKEIFYMTGDETPVDDFENNLNTMYVDTSPINYKALANSFLNKADSGSIETSKSMMPQSRPSHLEIRRSHGHDVVDFSTTDWGEWVK